MKKEEVMNGKRKLLFNLVRRKEVSKKVKKILCGIIVLGVILLFTPSAMAVGTPAGTVISNQAFADYEDANGNPLPRVYSNTVTTTVSQVAGVVITPETATKSAAQGTSLTFPATVTNSGNGDDTFALEVNTCAGWTATIYEDTNGNGILDAGESAITDTGKLSADETYNILVVVDIPSETNNGTTCDTTLTATSQFDGGVTDTSTYTTIVQDAVLSVIKSADTSKGTKPGDVITYAIEGRNIGSATAEDVVIVDHIPANTTYVPGSIRIGPVGGSYDTATPQTDADDSDNADYSVTIPDAITVNWGNAEPEPAPSGSSIIYFQVRVNDDVPQGTVISNVGDVDYKVGGNSQPTQHTSTASFKVDYLPDVLLSPDRSSSDDPGSEVVYAFTVYNNGNASDTIDLTYTSSLGWNWTIWLDSDGNGQPGTNGDVVLTDTDGDGKIDTGPLPPGESVSLLAVATIPAGVSDGSIDTTIITGISSIDTGVTDSENLTTTVTAPVLSVYKTVEPAGNHPPGTELTYTITVTNNGSGVATSVVITDTIPDYTTYVPGSIKTGPNTGSLTSRTDAADGDGAQYNSGTNTVVAGDSSNITIGPGSTWVLQFKVTID